MQHPTVNRVGREVEILAKEIGGSGAGGDRIKMGRVTVGDRDYIGVIIECLGVNPESFYGVKSVRALLLLPPEYPRLPPLGIYVNRDHRVASSHFVKVGYHGAPSLVGQGWRWFCHGVGGFQAGERRAVWRPAANPEDGHNLATVVAAARVAMNSNG